MLDSLGNLHQKNSRRSFGISGFPLSSLLRLESYRLQIWMGNSQPQTAGSGNSQSQAPLYLHTTIQSFPTTPSRQNTAAASQMFDPRSPTNAGADFSRTPLMFSNNASYRTSHSDGLFTNSSQIAFFDLMDPRSPGQRTPRAMWQKGGQPAQTSAHALLDPRSPSQVNPLSGIAAFVRTPISKTTAQAMVSDFSAECSVCSQNFSLPFFPPPIFRKAPIDCNDKKPLRFTFSY